MTAAPSHAAGLGRLWRLTRKELSESLRDRRTLGTLVLMPVLLYPVLAMAFLQLLQSSRVDEIRPLYRIGFISEAEKESVLDYWQIGGEHLRNRHAPSKVKGKEPELSPYLSPWPELDPYVMPDLDEAVSTGKVDVGVRLHPPGGVRAHPARRIFDCDLLYRKGSNLGLEATRYLESLTADANADQIDRLLEANRIQWRGDPVRGRVTIVPDLTTKKSQVMPVLVPLILILMTMTGAVYPAIDLTAGERERGTLEILVAAPVSRLVVLLAKYAAVFTVAMLTALVNLGSMTLSLRVTGIEKAVFESNLSALVLIQVLGLLLLFAAFFSAVVLTVTSFARSFKEAQAYLIPLMLLCLTPGMMALLPGLRLNGPLAVVPLLNIVLLARDLLGGTASFTVASVVVATTLLYALAAVSLAARVFGAEAVLSNDVSGWSDLLRRPRNSRPAAEPAAALLCLALMFPCYFLLMTGVAQFSGFHVAERLGLSALANVLLFIGFPLVFMWLGRVRLEDGLRFHVPSWSACVAAVLLGDLSLAVRQRNHHAPTEGRLRVIEFGVSETSCRVSFSVPAISARTDRRGHGAGACRGGRTFLPRFLVHGLERQRKAARASRVRFLGTLRGLPSPGEQHHHGGAALTELPDGRGAGVSVLAKRQRGAGHDPARAAQRLDRPAGLLRTATGPVGLVAGGAGPHARLAISGGGRWSSVGLAWVWRMRSGADT